MTTLECRCPQYRYRDGTVAFGPPVERCPMHGRREVRTTMEEWRRRAELERQPWRADLTNWDEPEHAPEEEP